jgi:hypothetical protein
MHVVYGLGRGGIQTGLENLLGRLDRNRFEHIVCALRPPIDHPMCQGLAHLAQVMCLRTTESSSRFQVSAIVRAIRDVESRRSFPQFGCIETVPAADGQFLRVVHGEHGFDSNLVGGEPRPGPGSAGPRLKWRTASCSLYQTRAPTRSRQASRPAGLRSFTTA